MPQATQAPTDHSFQTLQRRTLATHKAWAGDIGGWGLGGQWDPPISFQHINPGDYSLMGRIVDTETHGLAPNGGTGAELTHSPTWVPYPGSLGCCAPLEDHGEAKFSELTSSVFALPLSLHKQEDPVFLSVFPTPPIPLPPFTLHSSLQMVA